MKADTSDLTVEFVVVNDRSIDATGAVIDRWAANDSRIRRVDVSEMTVNLNLLGKAGAIHAGIQASTGQILLITDADCAVHPKWIATMASILFREHADMVCGFTRVEKKTLFGAIQHCEWVFMQSMARGGIGNGVVLGCLGNNLALSRSSYDATGGYSAIPFSITEDLALMQTISDEGGRIVYSCEREVSVDTIPNTSIVDYIRQKQRWARGGMALGLRATLFVLSSVAMWSALIMTAVAEMFFLSAGFLALRVITDGALIVKASVQLKERVRFWTIVFSLLLFIGTEFLLPILILNRSVKWKGQVFR